MCVILCKEEMEGKKRSQAWDFFDFLDDTKKKVKCRLCSVLLSYCGGTTTMNNHLERKHPSVFKQNSHCGSGNVKMIGSLPQQVDMRKFTTGGAHTMTQQRYQKITEKLAQMCALDFRPISIVSGPGFKEFVHTLDPSYEIPSHTTVRNYVNKSYRDAKVVLSEILLERPAIPLTTDLWTSHATQGYITLTSHFVDKNWDMRSQVLATRLVEDRHTGANIATEITKILDEFKLRNISGILHDNAANMEAAMKILNFPHFGCCGHTLQLAIHDGLKAPEITRTLARSRNLVSYFHRSLIATETLKKTQTADDEKQKPLSLIQDVSTRWNSSYLMLERLLKLCVPIYSVLHNRSVIKEKEARCLDMSDADWSNAGPKFGENIKTFAACNPGS